MHAHNNTWVIALVASLLTTFTSAAHRYTCTIPANGDGSDDTPVILSNFEECRNGGRIVFSPNTTYYINSVMNTTDLTDVQIDMYGYLLWSNDTSYWLNNSMEIGYQNQSTVWFLGGEGLVVNGYGTGTIDGNGQVWYDLVKGISNYPRRPMGLTIRATNSIFAGLNFVQSQMWTMTIQYSQNLTMQDIYVNSTSHNGNPARNTDGLDVMYSDDITLRRWEVDNGDDGISLKGNSTNILVEDSTLRTGQGFALGSIGQYPDRFEVIENVTVRNVTCVKTKYGGYVKTWTGEQVNYPPNGGGGGTGYIRNITLTDLTFSRVRSTAFSITQCTSFSGTAGDCDSSTFKISNISVNNFSGSINYNQVALMQCSAAAGGCEGIEIGGIELQNLDSETKDEHPVADSYLCSNVVEPRGFECTGEVEDNPGGS